MSERNGGNKFWDNLGRNEKILIVLYSIQLVLSIIIIIGWILWVFLKIKGY